MTQAVAEAAKLARETGLKLCFEQLRAALIEAEPDNAAIIRTAAPGVLLGMAERLAPAAPERSLEDWQRGILALAEDERRVRARWLMRVLDAA